MDVASFQIKRFQYFLVSLTLASALFIQACSSKSVPTFVDFSKKMVANQSSEESQDGSVIRVAVAAMISAKESVVYYHHLLDFVANQLGHKIQLIRRKTYNEINKQLKNGKIDHGGGYFSGGWGRLS